MKISRTLLSSAALLVSGLAPQAGRTCVATYTDFYLDPVNQELDAWSSVEDYFDESYCLSQAYYQWYYWEHSYEASVNIESPTQNSAYDFDNLASIPYGGGSAYASTSLSFIGDPGDYIIETILRIFCTVVGDYFVEELDDEVVTIPPIGLTLRLTFDDGPHVGGNEYTLSVVNTLAAYGGIEATFFVQTHVSYRGGSSAGASRMESTLAGGNGVMIHTGSDEDHGPSCCEFAHTTRAGQAPYAGGSSALESDLIRAKARIAGLQGGSVPGFVRPPFGATSSAVRAIYALQNLDEQLWDVDSGDTASNPTLSSILSALAAGISVEILTGNTDIVILFHDIQQVTANNLIFILAAFDAGFDVQYKKIGDP